MATLARNTLAGFIVMLLLAGCDGESRPSVGVESLREHLSELEAVARQWRQDAYLADADLPLHNGNPSSRLLSAGFNSPSTEFESLLVRILLDGSIEVERIEHTVPVRQVVPITTDDWKLDSPEALTRALDEAERRFLRAHADSQCSFLKLERRIGQPGEPVVWRLVLRECLLGGDSLPHILIDSMTGEVLERR